MKLKQENVKELFSSKYIRVFDLMYEEGMHYYDATRRSKEDLAALKSDTEVRRMVPDAVSCALINELPGQEPLLYLTQEFRYPFGQFLLSVPAGLIDPADRDTENPVVDAAIREIREETGITVLPEDEADIVNPLLLSSPGMTDESSAVVRIRIRRPVREEVDQSGAVGTEIFGRNGWVTKEEAKEILRRGTDRSGMFFSAMTWIVLMTFVSSVFDTE